MMQYKINTILKFFIPLVFAFNCSGQSGTVKQPETVKLTPVKDIKLIQQELIVPQKFKEALPFNYTVNIPQGYRASIFYAGRVSKCRFMTWGPDSVLYVANLHSEEVLALPDKNHDNIADTVIVAAKNANGHDVKFYNGAMYVAEENKVLKFIDNNKDGIFEDRSVFIDDITDRNKLLGGHITRTVVFDDAKKKIYLSVGSSCNVCREDDRAVIYEFDINGKNKKIFASGTRNCVGMTINPHTGDLWATNNGSDRLGDDIPPEWIDKIEKDGFYGFPFAYGHQVYFDFNANNDYRKILPITSKDSALVKKMKAPAALVQAHSAPMAIEFSNKSFKKPYDNGAFVSYRGSWNRETPTGYKVVYLHFNKNYVTAVSDFITGFLPPGAKKGWARPVGLQADLRGNLYMSSDDETQFILILSPKQ